MKIYQPEGVIVNKINLNKNAHCTKSGPGRFHKQGDGTHKYLTLKQRRAGSYAKGLRNWITQKQAAARV